jgi:broad specificity phosphatase PhoE
VTARNGGSGPLLVMVRHGQTDANLIKALDTRPPGAPLNARGHAQARAVAGRLAVEPVSAVYASAAVRAQQTAEPIAARHRLRVEVVEGVQEVFCGDMEGRSDHAAREEFDEVYAAWAAGDLARKLRGGESALDLRERFLPVLARLWERHGDQSNRVVVLVSHGAAIRLAAAALIGEYAETLYVPNTGRVVLAPGASATPGDWLVKFWEEGAQRRGDATGGAPE